MPAADIVAGRARTRATEPAVPVHAALQGPLHGPLEAQADRVGRTAATGAGRTEDVVRIVATNTRADLSGVQMDTSPKADREAKLLGAKAVAHGKRVAFRQGEYRPETAQGRALIGHEATHLAQQQQLGVEVQADPRELLEATLEASYIATWFDDDLLEGIDLLVRYGNTLPEDDPITAAVVGNLATVINEAELRGIEVPPAGPDFLRTHRHLLASQEEVAGLEALVDVVLYTLREGLPVAWTLDVEERLLTRRRTFSFLPAGEVENVRDDLEMLLENIDELVLLLRLVPEDVQDPELDMVDPIGWSYALQMVQAARGLRLEIELEVPMLATPGETRTLLAVHQARDAYLDAMTRQFSYTVEHAAEQLSGRTVFSSHWVADDLDLDTGPWPGHADTWAMYGTAMSRVDGLFAELGDFEGITNAPIEERVAFMYEQGDAALSALRYAHAAMLLHWAVGLTAAVRQRTWETFQMRWEDHILQSRCDGVAGSLAGIIGRESAPDEESLAGYQAELEGLRGEIEERFGQIELLETVVGWIANIISIIAGIRLMTWATGLIRGTGLAVGTLRFVVGSLAFSAGSITTRGLLTGQWPATWGALGEQVAMDMATLGFLKGSQFVVGKVWGRFLGGPPPAIAVAGTTFSALWAWSSGLTLFFDPNSRSSPGAVLETLLETGGRTALDLVAIHFGLKLSAIPALPSSGTDLGRPIQAEWAEIQRRGADIDARIRAWFGGTARDQAVLGELVGEGRSVVEAAREVMRRMGAAEGWDPAVSEALDGQLARELRALENLREGAMLGVEQVSEGAYRYRGSAENAEAYLGRLLRDGVITEMRPLRPGVFSVRMADGRLGLFYPEGSNAGVVDVDLTARAVQEATPTLDPPTRSRALVHLGRLPQGSRGAVVGQLEGRPAAEEVVAWLARPDVGAAMGRPDPFFTPQRIERMLDYQTFRTRVTGIEPADLQAWWESPFEQLTGGRGTSEFMDFLDAMEAHRGSLALEDPLDALRLASDLARSSEPQRLIPSPPSTGPAFTAGPSPSTDTTTGTSLRDRIEVYLVEQGYARESMLDVRIAGQTWVIRLQDGAPERAWRFSDTPALMEEEVPIADHLATIRGAVERAELLRFVGPDAALAEIEAVMPLVAEVSFLRDVRGPELRDTRALLERADPERFGAAPDPFIGPLTRSEFLGLHRDAIVERARRLGLPRDPAEARDDVQREAITEVEEARGRNPRGASRPDTLDDIERDFNEADTAMDVLADAALARVRGRIGGEALSRARRGLGLSDAEVGDVLDSTYGMQGLGEGELRGLLYAAVPPDGGNPVTMARLNDAAPSAAERNRAIDTYGRLMDAGIPGTPDVLRAMVGSSTSWRGGMWQLDFVRFRGGIEQVEAFEVAEVDVGSESVRVYDIKLRSGLRLEMKDWTHFFEGSLRSQFRRDVHIRTNGLRSAAGLLDIQWVFRGPGPNIEGATTPAEIQSHIRGLMRAELETVLADGVARGDVFLDDVQGFLDTFDRNTYGVQIVDLDPTTGTSRRLAPNPEAP